MTRWDLCFQTRILTAVNRMVGAERLFGDYSLLWAKDVANRNTEEMESNLKKKKKTLRKENKKD